jgi:hypothetical protein
MRLKRNVKSLLFRNARTSTTAELNRVNRKAKNKLTRFWHQSVWHGAKSL